MWDKIKKILYTKKLKNNKTIYKILGFKISFNKIAHLLLSIRMYFSLRYNKNQAIVMIDGGICSQIHQYRIGETLMARGIKVEYDLSWFTTYGKDINGEFIRNFDLLKAFPHLEFKQANSWKTAYFKKTLFLY